MQDTSLTHWGIKGMKWGVRRYQNKDGSLTSAGKKRYSVGDYIQSKKEQRKKEVTKIRNIQKKQGQNLDYGDLKRLKYYKDPYVKRLGKAITAATVQTVLADIMTDKAKYYRYANKKDITKRLTSILGSSISSVAINDYLAKSTLKRYSDSGRKTKKTGFITKEDIIEVGVSSAAYAAPALSLLAQMKMSQVANKNRQNRERFEKWGGNILSQKVDNVVWQSDDLKTAVIDNRKRD